MDDQLNDKTNDLPIQRPLLDVAEAYNPQQHDPRHMDKYAVLKQVLNQFVWAEDMAHYMALGWSWKKAAYIAWSILPKKKRSPKTFGDFGELIETSCKTISKWRQDQVLQAEIFRIRADGLQDHTQEVLDALVESAKNPSYRHTRDRQLFLQMTGYFTPSQTVKVATDQQKTDLSQLSEAELERAAQMNVIEAEVAAPEVGAPEVGAPKVAAPKTEPAEDHE